MRYDLATLKARLGSIKTDDNPAILKQKSRDFYWYSPTLKRQLDAVVGVDLDYEVLGANGSMLMVSASGTAIRC